MPFTGGIEEVLRRLAERYPWEPIVEDGRIVALHGAQASITLEPGGQLELSGQQCDSVHCASAEFAEHVEQIVTVGDELGIAFLGLGMQPVSALDEIEWVPKRRYRIMAPYMTRVGTLGQRMMKQTATVQVNIDYDSERDAMHKLRIGMGLAPLLTAMFANSPLSDGDLNGYLSFRGHIWTDTDNARSGLLPFVFRDVVRLQRLRRVRPRRADVLHRARRPLDGHDGATPSGEFWKEGYQGERATLADWNAHLTTLFPEFRLKGYIEARSIDSQAPELMLAVPALIKGIFYDADCLRGGVGPGEALDLGGAPRAVSRRAPAGAARPHPRHRAHRAGPRAGRHRGEPGCERQGQRDASGQSEAVYLERLRDLVRHGRCPAELLIEKWEGEWDRQVARLVDGTAYRQAVENRQENEKQATDDRKCSQQAN